MKHKDIKAEAARLLDSWQEHLTPDVMANILDAVFNRPVPSDTTGVGRMLRRKVLEQEKGERVNDFVQTVRPRRGDVSIVNKIPEGR